MFLGHAAAVGVDPFRVLRASPDELDAITHAVRHAHDYHEARDAALARLIVHEYAEAMKRGRRGR
jgi:hypothetical protein